MAHSKLNLATKFYLAVVLPLVIVSGLVTLMTYRGLKSNASNLAEILRIQGKANRTLSLQLSQDDASKAMLIDPSQLADFSSRKIEAYDEHKKLLTDLKTEAKSEEMRKIILELSQIDEQKLRPIDTKVLEMLFEDVDKARSMYFSEYEPSRKEYEKLVRDLASLGTQGAEVASTELPQKNLASLLQIATALLLGIIVVTIVITLLARQVERSERNTKSLLAVLNEGLFFFDPTGAIASERSQALERIVPGCSELTTLQEFVTKYSAVSEDNVRACLKLLWNEDQSDFFSDFDSTISFLPREFTLADGRIIHLEYRPLYNTAKVLEKVVVVAADVTQKLKNEWEAIIQAERVRKISKVASGIENYLGFYEEAVGLFKRADSILAKRDPSALEIVQAKRDLHTLKGSIGTFEFSSLAKQIHDLESLIDEHGMTNDKVLSKWEQVKDQWKFETLDIEQVLNLKEGKDKITILKSKFDLIMQHARTSNDRILLQLVNQSLQHSLKEIFSKYESYVDKLTERRTEKQIRVVYESDSSEISHAEIQRLDGAFVHIIRNCVDHGFEDRDERQRSGKPPMGTLQVACYRKTNGWLHFIIKDDGQGVNADKLAQKAIKMGLWTSKHAETASYQDKVELVFASNVSSKDDVTETSGRGVGMDAVKTMLSGMGGTISIHSQPGMGTQFEIDVPPLQTQG